MAPQRKKNFFSRVLFSPITFSLIGLIILVLISIPLVKKINQKYRIDQEIKDLEREIVELENNNTNLKEVVDYLESDQFVEEQARLQFGLKKEGEEAVVIKIEEAEQQQTNERTGNLTGGKIIFNNNLGKWFSYFFKNPKS